MNFSKNNWHFSNIHANGFKVILFGEIDGRIQMSFDLDGNQLGEPKPFLLKSKVDRLLPLPPRTNSSNLLAEYVEGGKRFVRLVDVDGMLIKNLVKFNDDHERLRTAVDIDDSSCAYCWQKGRRLYCAQFGEFGNEKFRGNVSVDGYVSLLEVRNLKEGVVAFTRSDTEVGAVEMRPGKVSGKSYPVKSRSVVDQQFVTEFDEVGGKFSLLTDYLYPEYKWCRRTFFLPSPAL